MIRMLLVLAALFAPVSVQAQSGGGQSAEASSGLYRITMIRAAPGERRGLKAIIERQGTAGIVNRGGRTIPYRLRHSQGDQWDFMLIQPLSSLAAYFSGSHQALEARFRDAVADHADFVEDWFARGPTQGALAEQFAGAGLYHLEMFKAGAGLKDELVDQRVRENRTLEQMGLIQNTVWTGLFGADWDAMTIGFHENWVTYGEHNMAGSDEDWDRAARAHGFDGAGDLAPQLRSFLTSHHDTFAVPMD